AGARRAATLPRPPPGVTGPAAQSDGRARRRSFALIPVHVVGSGETARSEQNDEQQRRHRERDNNRGQHKRLWKRIDIEAGIGGLRANDRRRIDRKPAHRVDEQVHRIGDQRKADDDLKRARSQYQPYARSGENADAEGQNQFHQASPSVASRSTWVSVRGVRIDWCAMAISMSAVAPTTRRNTPRSNSSALASGTSPKTGRSA